MINKEVIRKTFDNIIQKHNHISNDEIRTRMDSMSIEEKKEQLKDKLNPFEKENYDSLIKKMEFYNSFDKKDITNDMQDDINELVDELFRYEKRIVRGYDVDKYKNNVPEYDITKFKEDKVEQESSSLLPLEEAQINAQSDIHLNETQKDSLIDYFGNEEYKYINAELSPKYKKNFWEKDLSEEWRNHYHKKNETRIASIDSAINKCPGLVEHTVLYHGVVDTHLVDIHTRVGEHINFDMFISSSFEKDVGVSYGERIDGGKRLYCKFLSPIGTKGICGNDDRLHSYTDEHEYLLGRKNGGTVVDIDYDTGEVTILID